MKIHVYIAKNHPVSRRKAEQRVEEGRITVDGVVAHRGQVIQGDEVVKMDDEVIAAKQVDQRLLILNKPVGYVSSHVDQGSVPSVMQLLPKLSECRWMLVGRLDIATSGLLLVSNDGQLVQKLAHPSSGYERIYIVRVSGLLTDGEINRLKKGLEFEEGRVAFKHITPLRKKSSGRNHWYRVSLSQGRYRMIRRMFAELDMEVSRLKRIQFGPFILADRLKEGTFDEVDQQWLARILK